MPSANLVNRLDPPTTTPPPHHHYHHHDHSHEKEGGGHLANTGCSFAVQHSAAMMVDLVLHMWMLDRPVRQTHHSLHEDRGYYCPCYIFMNNPVEQVQHEAFVKFVPTGYMSFKDEMTAECRAMLECPCSTLSEYDCLVRAAEGVVC